MQLQDATESLWYRLNNMSYDQGMSVMEKEYYEQSMLYAFGSVLAYRRIMLLDGIYPQLKKDIGQFLKTRLLDFDNLMDSQELGILFYNYHRIALAEAVIQRINGSLRACTYLDFVQQFTKTDSNLKTSLNPAIEFVTVLGNLSNRKEIKKLVDSIMENLRKTAIRIGEETGIPSTIK